MQTGWLQIGDARYYLDASGAMLENVKQNIDGVDYRFGTDGNMIVETPASREQVEQWFYASYAVIANVNEWNAEYFEDAYGMYMSEAQSRLKKAWGVTDPASAHAMVDELINGLHRVSYQETMELCQQYGYMDLSQKELAAKLRGDSVLYDMIMAYKTNGPGAIDAWDYCRAMQVLRECQLAEYYSKPDTLDKMLEVATIMQNRFSSWDEMMESYLRGYEYWMGDASAYKERKDLYESLKAHTSFYQVDWYSKLEKKW